MTYNSHHVIYIDGFLQPSITYIGGKIIIARYEHPTISRVWSNENKLKLWQKTEFAVIEARANLGLINREIFTSIFEKLGNQEIDIAWWLKREEETKHDLNAFIDERLRFLPIELQRHWHDGLTSYDTEESAFVSTLRESVSLLKEELKPLIKRLEEMSIEYRYTVMLARTHGQWAEIESFGKRCLTWLVILREGLRNLERTEENLKFSKLSGAIGNYQGITAEIEEEALRILGFQPFYGATQILPRELYAPLAQAICQIVLSLNKIAIDIRLGARSGITILQEPFGKKQKGSSAMPHKKNTISGEKIEGMARAAKGYMNMLMDNVVTWEERAIEQSSVERIAWPDLFHVAIHAIKTMNKVLQGLTVYPDNMLKEINESCGCYAAGEVKEFLRHLGAPYGLGTEGAYRIVQLAAFNVFEPSEEAKRLRENPPTSIAEAQRMLLPLRNTRKPISTQDIIANGKLVVSDRLEANKETIEEWNRILVKIFERPENREKWNQLFAFEYLLKGENTLYEKILGV
ncbi:MAG: lyase family protein [Candidatus Paceibacterota bacterium]